MLELFMLLAFGIAFAGSLAAGLWDLKTTDIPDEITVMMCVLGGFVWYIYALTFGNFAPLLWSLLLGTGVFALGWLLYLAGKWGGGDALLLAGIFYLIPDVAVMFGYILNFLIVALVYTIAYAIVLAAKNPKSMHGAASDIKSRYPYLAVLLILAIASTAAYSLLGLDTLLLVFLWALVVLLLVFHPIAKRLEKSLKKKIPISALKEGDVLASSKKWTGITAEEIEELKQKKKKFVEVKQGIRFGLVFFIALVVTLLFGNLYFALLGI